MKRITKAMAVGTAAALSLGTVAAAQTVQKKGNVSNLVNTIEGNVDKTEVVIGSTADISDGQQAARIAATLVNQNYKQATQNDFEVSGGNATGTATVERTTANYEMTNNAYTLEYDGSSPAGSPAVTGGYETEKKGVTLRNTHLPDILNEEELEDIEVGGNETDFRFREKVEITTDTKVQYDEQNSPAAAHGLYWGSDSGVYDGNDVVWTFQMDAAGSGLPMKESFYTSDTPGTNDELPKFNMLGGTYALDIDVVNDDKVVLFPASTEGSIGTGESIEHNGYTVTLQSVDTSGETADAANVEVEYNGETKPGINIDDNTGEEVTLGNETLSIYVDTTTLTSSEGTTSERARLLLGSGEVDLTDDNGEGDPFPLDEDWEIHDTTSWISSPSSGPNELDHIKLKYGNDDATEYLHTGEFTATAVNEEGDEGGMKVGDTIKGPETTGNNFEINFQGFGSKTPNPTTQLDIDIDEDIAEVTWTDKAGKENVLDPSGDDDINLTVDSNNAPSTNGVVLDDSGAQYTVINNKVVYLDDVDTSDNEATFHIHGRGKDSITLENGTTLNPNYGGDGLNCDAWQIYNNNKVLIEQDSDCDIGGTTVDMGAAAQYDNHPTLDVNDMEGDSLYSGEDYSNEPHSSADTLPINLSIDNPGDGVVSDSEAIVWQNESTAVSNHTLDSSHYTVIDYATGVFQIDSVPGTYDTGETFYFNYTARTATEANNVPVIELEDKYAGGAITAFYDNSTSDDGVRVYQGDRDTAVDSVTTYVDYGQSDVEESDKYHVTANGAEIDTSSKGSVEMTIPENTRNALLKVQGLGAAGEGQTVSEGESFDGWKLTSINAETSSGEIANPSDFYKATKTLSPTDLTVMDSAASDQYKVVVGGPSVNEVAKGMSGASDLKKQGNSVLSEDGNKLLVAGYSATDTANAADELVTLLTA